MFEQKEKEMSGYYAGWDGGGTSTTVKCINKQGEIVLHKKAGPLNPSGNSVKQVEDSIISLLQYMDSVEGGLAACKNLCISCAGISNLATSLLIQDILGKQGYQSPFFLISDSESALHGALGDEAGIILISGTGSICYSQTAAGKSHRIGGWGQLIDDEGSGYAIGRDVLKAVVQAFDGRADRTLLTPLVHQQLGIDTIEELITYIYHPDTGKKDIACLAPLCFIACKQNDPIALRIQKKAADELITSLETAAKTLKSKNATVILLGSILQQDTGIKNILTQNLAQLFPDFVITEPKTDAAHGAALLAKKHSKIKVGKNPHSIYSKESNMTELETIHNQVKEELQTCIDFWLKNGIDTQHGGVYTCLDKEGKVYSTDKSVWMQGRCAWMFSKLCNEYGVRDEWKNAAESCLEFLEKHCINREKGNRMYFTVTADGKPLRQRRYNFSEGFYCMANAEYYAASKETKYIERARASFEMIWNLNNNFIQDPTAIGAKTNPETREMRSLASPMIYLNLCMTLLHSDPENSALYLARARECSDIILNLHFKPELNATLENVGLQGEFYKEISAGRIVNPGHDMECVWFLLEYAQESKDADILEKATKIFDFAYKGGWDNTYGGLLYFTDVLGFAPESYEHDMKLWWPHNELLIASLMLYKLTGNEKYIAIFAETWQYCREVFSDPAYGEWFGYLRRDGKPTEPAAKGSTFKGPFHLPRMLTMVDKMLDKMP